jgi:hypothetical protein
MQSCKPEGPEEETMLALINLYARREFVVTTCLSDLEFAVTQGALMASGVILNTCGP